MKRFLQLQEVHERKRSKGPWAVTTLHVLMVAALPHLCVRVHSAICRRHKSADGQREQRP